MRRITPRRAVLLAASLALSTIAPGFFTAARAAELAILRGSIHSVTGDPINVASRIEGLTSKLQVDLLITDDIRRLLGDEFDLQAMPPSIVKGKGEPIQTYRVESLSSHRGPAAPLPGPP